MRITNAYIDGNGRQSLVGVDTSGNPLIITGHSLTNANALDVAIVDGSGNQIKSTNPLSVSITPTSSDFYPMYNAQSLGKGQLFVDPAGALVVRGAITTDEGVSRSSFTGSSVLFSPGTATFTNGSTAVTGSGFSTADLHYLDYIKLGTDSEAAWAQIAFVNSDTSITLFTSYTGTGGTGTYNVSQIATTTGTGATISVASGQLTVALGTNTSAATSISRGTGDGNCLYQTAFSISQRIANQDIYAGLETALASPIKQFARFHFTSTTNTQVITETGYNPTTDPSASEQETNTVTLPASATTASVNTYKIEQYFDQIIFSINNVIVATHVTRIPHVASEGGNVAVADIRGVNSGAVTATSIVVNYVFVKSFDRLELNGSNVQTSGTVASGATDYGNPVKIGGVYNTTAPVLTNGQRGDLQVDLNSNLKVTEAGKIAGEDTTNDRLKVVFSGSVTPITTAATTIVKSGAGYVFGLLVTGGISGTIKAFDNTAGSGTSLADFDQTNTMGFYPIYANFSTGLTIVTGAATKVSVIYA